MKKYLLLAATAMLFSTNAMATTYPDLDGQTANVNVSANIVRVCQFTTGDTTINFGTLYVADSDDTGTFEAIMYYDEGGSLNSGSRNVIGTAGTSALAYLGSTCQFQGFPAPHHLSVSCVGSGDPDDGGCNVGSTNYKFTPSYPSIYSRFDIGGTLTGPIPDTNTPVVLNNASSILFTIEYE